MSRKLRWTMGIAIVVIALIIGFSIIVLEYNNKLNGQGWQPLGIAFAVLGALGGFILCIVESEEVVHHDEHMAQDKARAEQKARDHRST